MNRIALIGPGAIGGLVAAWLCQDNNNHVAVCARTPLHHLELDSPYGRFVAQPEILRKPGDGSPIDWILVATKAYDSAAAAEWMPALMNEHTRVAVLQNGVDHVERFTEFLPAGRILPVIVDCPTERASPSAIRQRGPATVDVPCGKAGESFCDLFAATEITATQNPDFLTAAWRKLCINAAGVVNALSGKPAGVVNDEYAASLMRRIIEETAAVGRAEGAELAPGIGDEVIEIYRGHPADSVNSLLADRQAGRPLEIDLRNGVVGRLGRKHGIDTPCNDMAVALLKIR